MHRISPVLVRQKEACSCVRSWTLQQNVLPFSLKSKTSPGTDRYFSSGVHTQTLPHKILPLLTKSVQRLSIRFPARVCPLVPRLCGKGGKLIFKLVLPSFPVVFSKTKTSSIWIPCENGNTSQFPFAAWSFLLNPPEGEIFYLKWWRDLSNWLTQWGSSCKAVFISSPSFSKADRVYGLFS